jgi:hypothetical protein
LRFPEDCWLQAGKHAANSTATTIHSRSNLISFSRTQVKKSGGLKTMSQDLRRNPAFYFVTHEIRQRFSLHSQKKE